MTDGQISCGSKIALQMRLGPQDGELRADRPGSFRERDPAVQTTARDNLEEFKRSHPEQMQKVIMDLEAQFTSSMSDMEDQLLKPSWETDHLQKQHWKCLGE